MMESTELRRWVTHMLCWTCAMYFSAAASSENDQGSMEPLLVRAQHRPTGPRRAAPGQAFGHSMHGGHPGRDRGGHGSGVRSQVHRWKVRGPIASTSSPSDIAFP